MEENILTIFIILTAAAAIPFMARKMGIPAAVLEIIFGIILFHTFLSKMPEWFLLLKEIGFLYLMFLAGMELNLQGLLRENNLVWYIVIPVLSFVITPAICVVIGYHFYVGIAVSVVSAGIVLPVLKEEGMIKTLAGKSIVAVVLAGELLSIAVLTGIDIYHRKGFSMAGGIDVIKLVVLLILAAGLLKLLYITAWWNPGWVEKVMESEDPVEEGIRVVIAIAFAGALLAYHAGVEPILGSFMAGVVFSSVFKSKGRFEEKINGVGFGFFTPFFFMGVGATLNVEVLKSYESILLAIFLTVMIFTSNIYPLIFSRYMKLTFSEAFGMMLLLSSPLSMIVVADTLGIKMGFLDPKLSSSLILAAIMSGLLFPALFKLVSKKMQPLNTIENSL